MTQASFREIYSAWMANFSPQTKLNYTYNVERAEKLSQEVFGRPFMKLTYAELIQLRDKQQLSPRTAATITCMYRSFFNYLRKHGFRKDNPAEDLRPPKFPDTLADRIIDHKTVELLIRVAVCRQERLMLKILYLCGLRVSELCHLKGNDLLIRPVKGRNSFTLRVWGKGQRTDYIKLSEELGSELAQYICENNGSDRAIFTNRRRQSFKRSDVARMFRRLTKLAGLTNITPHFFRHAHATQMLQNGADIVTVQRSLRHRSIQTTTAYLHIDPDLTASDFLPKLEV